MVKLHAVKQRFSVDDRRIIASILVVKAFLFLFAAQSYQAISGRPISGLFGWLVIWNRWDSAHYLFLAHFGYQRFGPDRLWIVYFPLFPWLIRLVRYLVSDYFLSGILVSTVCSITAALLFFRLARLDHSAKTARMAVWFLFIFPASYFLHIAYTESLFLTLLFGSFLAARTNRWIIAGVLGALASMARIDGTVLIPALATEAVIQYREHRHWRWSYLGILIIATGLFVYLWLNQSVTGSPLSFLAYQHIRFHRAIETPFEGLRSSIGMIMSRDPRTSQMVGVQEFTFTILGLVATVYCWARQRLSYGVWMIVNWLIFTSSSLVESVPRYTLALFPLFILFAQAARYPAWRIAITVWSLLYLALFSSLFVMGYWAF